MTDLEITKLCAEAMGFKVVVDRPDIYLSRPSLRCYNDEGDSWYYLPLHDDAQAMAMVKRFSIMIDRAGKNRHWWTFIPEHDVAEGDSEDLNRAICECVAKIQLAKNEAHSS